VDELFAHPVHPYSELLLRAIPSAAVRGRPLDAIPGRVPDSGALPAGCAFHPRCPIAVAECRSTVPTLSAWRPSHEAACHRAGSVILAQETQ
jgi:oligopeptide/dipeptide ABC transporter ATP-binding protein